MIKKLFKLKLFIERLILFKYCTYFWICDTLIKGGRRSETLVES